MPREQPSNPEITEELGYAYMTDAEAAGDLIRRYGPGPVTDVLRRDYNLDANGRPAK